jgi:hypothetical protein
VNALSDRSFRGIPSRHSQNAEALAGAQVGTDGSGNRWSVQAARRRSAGEIRAAAAERFTPGMFPLFALPCGSQRALLGLS